MIGAIILTVILVVIIYFYMRHKSKNSSSDELNTVQEYHQSYDRIRTRKEIRDKQNTYRSYITKYNSSEDYRDKN
ncbi:MAG: hypothetical protein LUI12_10445 [Clostridiales bacterium]|nr:hypothetical protein [Clostridiales bacterium]